MNLYYTQTTSCFLDNALKTPAESEEGCRVTEFEGWLYCVYIDGSSLPGRPKYMRWTPAAGWSEPQSVFEELRTHHVPHLFTFNGALHVLAISELGSTVLATYDTVLRQFVIQDAPGLPSRVVMTPGTVVYSGRLYLFYRWESGNVFYVTTPDLKRWTRSTTVMDDMVPIRASVSPVVVEYQGLIHLVYKASDGYYLIKISGEHSTRPQLLVAQDDGPSAGAVVHNGLLKVLVVCKNNGIGELHLFGYDGNAIGLPVRSSTVDADASPGVAVLNDTLVVVYRAKP